MVALFEPYDLRAIAFATSGRRAHLLPLSEQPFSIYLHMLRLKDAHLGLD
jgi:hypothetical protein